MPGLREDRPTGGKRDHDQLVPKPHGLFHWVQLRLAWAGSGSSGQGGQIMGSPDCRSHQ